MSTAIPTPPTTELQDDIRRSLRNAFHLGISLLATTIVGFGVRIFLPRHLGPEQFGAFQFADAFTTSVLVIASLGVETYVRKEVSVQSDHASDFFGGTLLVQLGLSLLVMLISLLGLGLAGRSRDVLLLVSLFGVVQVLLRVNTTYGALLQAVGRVAGLSVLSVAAKLIWGVGILVVFSLGGGVLGVAAAMLASEAIRAALLTVLVRRNLNLKFRVNRAATWHVVVAGMPYYVAGLAQVVYARVDVALMSFLTNDREVGWYGAASMLTGMSLLLAPLISWVLLPLSSRAAARSEEELTNVTRRAMELILTLAIPTSLSLYVGAEDIVRVAYGVAFAPATASLRVMAPLFVLTYAAMVSASVLIRLGRGWTVTWISVAGMICSVLLNLWLIPLGLARLGPGGAGIGAGSTLMITEVLTTVVMTWQLGGRAFDRRAAIVIGKTLFASAAVLALDTVLHSVGAWRYLVEGGVYASLIFATGAVHLRDVRDMVGHLLARRRQSSPSEDAA